MADSNNHHQNLPEAERIEPIAFQALSRGYGRAPRRPVKKWLMGGSAALVGILLIMAVWFVFTARQVSINITPAPDRISISGGLLTPRLGGHYMLRPGRYTILAEKTCFTPLTASFVVANDRVQRFTYELRQSPGKLSIQVHEANKAVENSIRAMILIDGQVVGTAPIAHQDVEPGRRELEVRADQYQPFKSEIEIEGCAKEQRIQVALAPGWAEVNISSIPAGSVSIDNRTMGPTPLKINLPAGVHDLHIQAEGHKPWQRQLTVNAGEPIELKDIRLQPADGRLTIASSPAGASVMIGDRFAGQTPLTVELTPDREHVLYFSKVGFAKAQRIVTIGSDEKQNMRVRLTAQKGVVTFDLELDGVELLVNGQRRGPVPERLTLPALPHEIELRRKGYQPYKTRITPRPGLVQQIKAALKPLATTITPDRGRYKAGNGYPLVLIHPQSFTIGSSRREQGRRSNETLRQVRLTRPFLIGVREVTNQEFRAFAGAHNSGAFKTHTLNSDDQPVVQVTWQAAAQFCNWLSVRDGLPAAYAQQGEKLVAAIPLPKGYRLPTEAEWEYSARFDGKQAAARYPWGGSFPPTKKSGNFGDVSAKNLFSRYIEGYNDDYVVTAPPARFKANALGLFDMGGNVAEWCHDVYAIDSSRPDKVYVDPTGPPIGDLWVIKGSGWRDSSISELRAAFRGYGNDKRDDVGFRVCRYAQ